jgi:hypothetical protein
MDIESKVIENKKRWTISMLKEACEILSLEKSGTRDDLCKRVVDYLAVPIARSGARSTPKKSKVPNIKNGICVLAHIIVFCSGNEKKTICKGWNREKTQESANCIYLVFARYCDDCYVDTQLSCI